MALKNYQEHSEASAKVTEAQLRTAFNRIVRDSVPLVATWVGLLYIAFAVKHALTLPEPAASLMSMASGGGAVALLGFRLALRRWTIPERWAHPVMAMIGGVLLLTNFLHLYLVSEPHQTVNLLVDVVGAGFLMLSTGWLALFILATLLGWGSIVLISPPSPGWLYYAFALSSATVLAVLVHTFRLRALRRLETARIQDQSRTAELEAALAATAASQMKLRESEVKFRTLAETIIAGIFIYQGTKMRYVNSAAERLSGYRREELLAMDFWEIIHPEFQALVKERGLARQRGENVSSRYEVKILTKNGESRWVDFTATLTEFEGKPAVFGTALDITVRQRAEEALRESEERLRQLAEHVDEALWLYDLRSKKILYVSPAHEKIWGTPNESLYQNPAAFLEMIQAEDRQRVVGALAKQKRGEYTDEEYRVIQPNGALHWVRDRAFPIRNKKGEVYRLAGIAQDLTARKQMEEALRASEERYHALHDDNPSMYFTVDEEGKVLSVNRFGAEQLGYAVEELVGQPVFQVFHEQDKIAVRQRFIECLQNSGQVHGWEYRKVRKDGSILWVQEGARAVQGADGQTIVLIVCEDITARKQAEEALQQSEARYRTLVENSPDAIYVHRDGKVLYANPASARLIGASHPQQLLGKSVIDFVAAEYRPLVAERMRRIMQEGITLPFIEVKGIRLDGTSIEVETMGLPIIYQGQPAAQVIVRDITERKRAEEALRESEARYRLLAENSRDLIGLLDLQGSILYASPSHFQVLGYAPEELVHNNVFEVIHPDDAQQSLAAVNDLLASGASKTIEIRLRKKSGPWLEVEAVLSVIADQAEARQRILLSARDITGRKQAEQTLHASEERYRSLYDNNPSMYFTVDGEGRVLSVNRFGVEQLGYTVEELVGQPVLEVFHEQDKIAVRQHLTECLKNSGQVHRWEFRKVRKDGSVLWVKEAARAIQDADGRTIVLIVCEDITAGKQMEEKLRESEQRFRKAFENTPIGMALTAPDSSFLQVNHAFCEMLDYSEAELLSMNFQAITHPEDRSISIDFMHRLLTGDLPFADFEKRYLHKHGHVVWARLNASAIRNALGQPLYFVTQIQDITARKRTEEKLRQTVSHLHSVLAALPELYFHVAADGMIIDYHAPKKSDLYLPSEQFLGKRVHEVLPLAAAASIQNAITGALQANAVVTIEYSLLMPEGERFYEARFSPFLGKEAITLIRDITERKQMEEQLQRYANDLEKMVEARAQRIRELEKQQIESEKLAATGRMAARIAHEINNPLGMIQTAFRLVSNTIPQEHRHHHYVGKIEKEIDRIAQIVRQMLDLHKPHQESPQAFRADEAIGEVIALMRPKFHERHLDCEQDLQRARKTITLPENMLRQVLYNVILNAVEASPPNGLVRVTAEIAANRLQIAVVDHGEGIPEEIRSRIFEPFFTTKSNGSTGGMGLGLSICKSQVEAMRGSIELESAPGEGTICRIAIPLDKKDKNEKNDKTEKHA